MPYAGKTVMPRTIADMNFQGTGWRNYELTKSIATALGESGGSLGAWNDNEDDNGVVLSRDCGLYQINIPANKIGTTAESDLRTESVDEAEYLPVMAANIQTAWNMYNRDWVRDGKMDIRRWQAWYAYTLGWATFPEAWVWKHVNGVPEGPWVPTGRYIHKAIAGQMNFHIVTTKMWTAEVALTYGMKYAKHFGVEGSFLYIGALSGILHWKHDKMPENPPADGIGPRPVKNNGV